MTKEELVRLINAGRVSAFVGTQNQDTRDGVYLSILPPIKGRTVSVFVGTDLASGKFVIEEQGV